MGFFLRKTVNFGGIRLNLSNSGIGFSTGVKGFRVGIDGKGRGYIGGGVGMLRFRQGLGSVNQNEYITDNDDINTISTVYIPKEFKGNGFLTFLMVIGALVIMLILLSFAVPPYPNADDLKYSLVVICICLLPYLGLPKNRRAADFQNAIRYYNNKNFFKASSIFENLYNKRSKYNSSTRAYLADTIVKCLDATEQHEKLIGFVKDNPDIKDNKIKFLGLLLDLEKYNDVIAYYIENKQYFDNLNHKSVVIYVALAYMNACKFKDALDYMLKNRTIIAMNDFIIKCYFELENYQELINFIQKNISDEAKEEYPVYYSLLAKAFLKTGNKEAALESMLSGPVAKRTMNDDMCDFRYQLGLCYEANGDIKNALKQYQKVYAYDVDYEDVAKKIEDLKN